MENQSFPQEQSSEDRISARYYAIFWTTIYLILFPFFFYIALLSGMIFDKPTMTVALGLWIMFMLFWIPLSMPISIYLAWSYYFKDQYTKSRYFCGLPILVFVLVVILNGMLQTLFLD